MCRRIWCIEEVDRMCMKDIIACEIYETYS